jgi:hypothetical protein
MEVIPYKFETTSSSVGVAPVNARPIYCCIDPESTGPGSSTGIASYGNMTVAMPYEKCQRSLPYT